MYIHTLYAEVDIRDTQSLVPAYPAPAAHRSAHSFSPCTRTEHRSNSGVRRARYLPGDTCRRASVTGAAARHGTQTHTVAADARALAKHRTLQPPLWCAYLCRVRLVYVPADSFH